mgnify:FL=1
MTCKFNKQGLPELLVGSCSTLDTLILASENGDN